MHFFTSITANYLPKARVLARSLKRENPDAVFHLVLADRVPDGFELAREPFDRVIAIEELGIPDLDSWIFKHSVVELCTAIKGAAFLKIFDSAGADKVVYLDPDIVVLNPLDELSRLLDSHEVVLTPHQLVPEQDYQAIIDNEICSLKHGVFNLGFLAVARGQEGMRFLNWWRDRLLLFCYDDIPNGLFTDQKWVDLAPCFFDVHILKDKSYNVATWNLTHREVTSGRDGRLEVEGSPIKFFHFSGFDSGDQEIMLKRYAPSGSPLFDLRKWYLRELKEAGQEEFGDLPCIYSTFSNGEPIPYEARLLYRSRADLIKAFPRPAQVTEDRNCYYWWFKVHGAKEMPAGATAPLSQEDRLLLKIRNSILWRGAKRVVGSSAFLQRVVRRMIDRA